jgi:hypothetical protein
LVNVKNQSFARARICCKCKAGVSSAHHQKKDTMSKHTIHTPGNLPPSIPDENGHLGSEINSRKSDGAESSLRDILAAMQAKIDAQEAHIAAMRKVVPVKLKEASLPTEAEGMAQAKETGQNVLSQSGWCMAPAIATKA